MKKHFKIFTLIFLLATTESFAQTGPQVWPKMKAFHSVMSATFHPTEENNFAPLKAKSDSLVIIARLWQASPIASDYKPVETKAALEKLVKQCEVVNKAVKENADDQQLKKLMAEAHDIFHTIVGECRKEE